MRRICIALNVLMGLGAPAGSFLALSSGARAAVGIDTSMLVNSPFTTFLIPGLFLLVVLGLGNWTAGFLTLKKHESFAYYECLIGLILCLWLIIQCIMILDVVFLHVLFFSVGAAQFILGMILAAKQKQPFPFSANQN